MVGSGVATKIRELLATLWRSPRTRALARLGFLPAAFYLAFFCVFTFPMIGRFSSHFFTDQGDGLQNVWNLWWVNKAVTELGQSPWHTDYLHHPFGVTLLAHTLNAFNGFLGIPLQTFLTLKQTHNLIILFSFVAGGLTAFWLSLYLLRAYGPSLAAGFIFTFSNFHFAHAQGHMQLVSLEWIPLFLLCWYVLVTRPTWRIGVAAALALFLVILCDYYYFFYCVLAGALMLGWLAWRRRSWRALVERERLIALGVFVCVTLITVGPLAFSLLRLYLTEPLEGVHLPRRASADLLGALIPGGHWRFAELTRAFWSRLPGNMHEKSIHLGLSVLAVATFAVVRRRHARTALGPWLLLLGFFWLLALGPHLQVLGHHVEWLKLPYALLEIVFPPVRMSGVPVRAMVMVSLAAGLVCAAGLDLLGRGPRRQRLVLVVFAAVLVLEYWPRPMPSNPMREPPHIRFLTALPKDRAILDLSTSPGRVLYFQTVHEMPMALGYVSRVPKSLAERERALRRAVRANDLAVMRAEHDVHYYLKREGRRVVVLDTATGEAVYPTAEP